MDLFQNIDSRAEIVDDNKFFQNGDVRTIDQTMLIYDQNQNDQPTQIRSDTFRSRSPQPVLGSIPMKQIQLDMVKIAKQKSTGAAGNPMNPQKNEKTVKPYQKSALQKGSNNIHRRCTTNQMQSQAPVTQNYIDMYFTETERQKLMLVGGVSANFDDKQNLVKFLRLPADLQKKLVDLFSKPQFQMPQVQEEKPRKSNERKQRNPKIYPQHVKGASHPTPDLKG